MFAWGIHVPIGLNSAFLWSKRSNSMQPHSHPSITSFQKMNTAFFFFFPQKKGQFLADPLTSILRAARPWH